MLPWTKEIEGLSTGISGRGCPKRERAADRRRVADASPAEAAWAFPPPVPTTPSAVAPSLPPRTAASRSRRRPMRANVNSGAGSGEPRRTRAPAPFAGRRGSQAHRRLAAGPGTGWVGGKLPRSRLPLPAPVCLFCLAGGLVVVLPLLSGARSGQRQKRQCVRGSWCARQCCFFPAASLLHRSPLRPALLQCTQGPLTLNCLSFLSSSVSFCVVSSSCGCLWLCRSFCDS